MKLFSLENRFMGHVEVDAYIRGVKEEVKPEKVIVDTGATYTVLRLS